MTPKRRLQLPSSAYRPHHGTFIGSPFPTNSSILCRHQDIGRRRPSASSKSGWKHRFETLRNKIGFPTSPMVVLSYPCTRGSPYDNPRSLTPLHPLPLSEHGALQERFDEYVQGGCGSKAIQTTGEGTARTYMPAATSTAGGNTLWRLHGNVTWVACEE